MNALVLVNMMLISVNFIIEGKIAVLAELENVMGFFMLLCDNRR